MKTKADVILWVKENNLDSMVMQVFPPDGWMWKHNPKTKKFDLENFETGETVTIKDVAA